MLQETIGALGYEETDPVSKAILLPLLEYGIAAPAVGVALLLHFGVVPRGVPKDGPFKLLFAAVRFDGLGTGCLATALPVVPSNNLILASRDKIQSVMSARGLHNIESVEEARACWPYIGRSPVSTERKR